MLAAMLTVSRTREEAPAAASQPVSSCLNAVVLLSQTPILLSHSAGMFLKKASWSTIRLTSSSCRPKFSKCVCACVQGLHEVWIKSRQKVGAFFSFRVDVAPHQTAAAAVNPV